MSVALFEEHRAIVEAAEQFLAAIKRTPRPPIEDVTRLRMRLSSLIRKHRVTEERHIYGPLMRGGGVGRFPELEAGVQELLREKVLYSEHIRKWSPLAIERDWHGYVAACEERFAAVKRVIDEEEAGIYRVMLSLAPGALPSVGAAGPV